MNEYEEFFDRPMTDPVESPKQFARYMVYRGLPKIERSVRRASEVINEAGDDVNYKTLQNTAMKFKWTDRVKAYDTYLANMEIQVLEASLDQAIEYVTAQEDVELIMATRLVQRVLGVYANKDEPEDIKLQDMQRILKSLDTLHMLRRRRAGMPTSYVSKEAEPQDLENQTFIIGG